MKTQSQILGTKKQNQFVTAGSTSSTLRGSSTWRKAPCCRTLHWRVWGAPGVAPRPDSYSVAGWRKLELDQSLIVQETNNVVGGCRGVSEDLTEPPEVGADGENIAAETIGTFLVRDKAVAWRQKSGALIS